MQTTNFTLSAKPGTDIWRKPPSTNVFNAPHSLGAAKSLSAFTRARITFSASWRERYDQGGLLLRIAPPGSADSAARWLKTGVEFYACDEWADWSIFPKDPAEGDGTTTLEVRREGDELGSSLWVYYLVLDASGEVAIRYPLREVNWVFAREDEDLQVAVGAYAARPASGEPVQGEELQVFFKEILIE